VDGVLVLPPPPALAGGELEELLPHAAARARTATVQITVSKRRERAFRSTEKLYSQCGSRSKQICSPPRAFDRSLEVRNVPRTPWCHNERVSLTVARAVSRSSWVASVGFWVGALLVTVGGGRSVGWLLLAGLILLPFSTMGAVLGTRVPDNPMAWLFLGCGTVVAAATLLQAYSTWALGAGLPAGLAAAVAVNVIYGPLVAGVLAAMLLLFPDGRLPSRRWRSVARFEAATFVVFTVAQAVGGGPLNQLDPSRSVQNPFAIGGRAAPAVDGLAAVSLGIILVLVAASAVSLVRRFRQASGASRQQLKWFGTAAILVSAAYGSGVVLWNVPGHWAVVAWPVMLALTTGTLPVATGIAILRYRLYDIDVIIRRTIVYTALVGSLVIVYLGGIYLIGRGLQTITGQSGGFAVTLSTLLVAAAFQPLRARIQHGVDHRFYRATYDAVTTLEEFTGRLREQVDLDALNVELLEVVAATVHPRHASLWLRSSDPTAR
jgi:hypothetical protein